MFSTFSTDLGYMAFATLGGEVVGLTFGHRAATEARRSLHRFHSQVGSQALHQAMAEDEQELDFHERIVDLLTSFAAGEEIDFADVPVSIADMTDFQMQVVAACRAIPWGETVSYGQLARRVGHPGAARAVGTVMRKNRFPLIVPCHRVVGSGGALGGYSAPSGLAMKRRLLAMERQKHSVAEVCDLGHASLVL